MIAKILKFALLILVKHDMFIVTVQVEPVLNIILLSRIMVHIKLIMKDLLEAVQE
jgi:hypothetical protein